MRYRFFSDTNCSQFKEFLQDRDIEFEETNWDVIEVMYPTREVEDEAYSLGASECNP